MTVVRRPVGTAGGLYTGWCACGDRSTAPCPRRRDARPGAGACARCPRRCITARPVLVRQSVAAHRQRRVRAARRSAVSRAVIVTTTRHCESGDSVTVRALQLPTARYTAAETTPVPNRPVSDDTAGFHRTGPTAVSCTRPLPPRPWCSKAPYSTSTRCART